MVMAVIWLQLIRKKKRKENRSISDVRALIKKYEK
jgi:hypothetical protein